MKKYFSFFKMSFIRNLEYRSQSIFHILGIFFQSLLVYYLWNAISDSNKKLTGFMVLVTLLSDFMQSNAGTVLGNKIINGTVSEELIKPLRLDLRLISESIGNSFFRLFTAIIPTLLIFTVVGYLHSPTAFRFLLFCFSSLVGCFIIALISLFVGFLSFIFDNWWGAKVMLDTIISFCSGAMVPIQYMPSFLRNILFALPFNYSISVPSLIYTGSISLINVYKALFVQITWLLVLIVMFGLCWEKAQRRVNAYGG